MATSMSIYCTGILFMTQWLTTSTVRRSLNQPSQMSCTRGATRPTNTHVEIGRQPQNPLLHHCARLSADTHAIPDEAACRTSFAEVGAMLPVYVALVTQHPSFATHRI
jgi:hypothetical protein